MHQNRASPFASDFYRRRGCRKELRNEDHFYPFSSQKKSRFASNFLRRGNRASWGLEKSRDCLGSGNNRRRSRRESRDFGALSWAPPFVQLLGNCIFECTVSLYLHLWWSYDSYLQTEPRLVTLKTASVLTFFFTQISGRKFLPELCGEVHPETAPLQALCCALCSTEQSTFRGGEKGEKMPKKGRNGEEEGWPTKGAKGKKDARKQVSVPEGVCR